MNKGIEKQIREASNIIDKTVSGVDKHVEHVLEKTDVFIDPYRKSAFQKFPTLFMLLVTFGVVSTYFGFEKLISNVQWLDERPILILGIGLAALMFTGMLHKKL